MWWCCAWRRGDRPYPPTGPQTSISRPSGSWRKATSWPQGWRVGATASVAPRKKARMGPSPPRTAKEAAKEVAQGGAQGGEDSAATEEDSDTDVDEEDECWDEDDDEEHVERAVERAIANPTKWPPQVPPCNYGEQCDPNCYP